MKLLLDMIQPSQLYINRDKLDVVHQKIRDDGIKELDPIPIKEINNEMVATDGHTRLFALYQLGIDEVDIEWETEELEWDLYEICVEWCHDNDIWAIQHLEGRIISSEEYEELWINRCHNLKIELYGEDNERE